MYKNKKEKYLYLTSEENYPLRTQYVVGSRKTCTVLIREIVCFPNIFVNITINRGTIIGDGRKSNNYEVKEQDVNARLRRDFFA